MQSTRSWERERSWGTVNKCIHAIEDADLLHKALAEREAGALFAPADRAMDRLRERYQANMDRALASGVLVPGELTWTPWPDSDDRLLPSPVEGGSILCCACAVGAECHRRWLAPFLVKAGWDVRLDGHTFTEEK